MKFLQFIFTFIFILGFSQTYKITYEQSFEGKADQNQDRATTFVTEKNTTILSQKILDHKKNFPFEVFVINNQDWSVESNGFLKNNEVATSVNIQQIKNYKFDLTSEKKKILGYNCQKAVTKINSNTIEVWYTNDLKNFGGPSLIGANLGLVLEVVRNGNSKNTAIKVEKVKAFDFKNLLQNKTISQSDELSYKDKIWKSKFTTIPVFENQTINFSEQQENKPQVLKFANGTIALKKVKFPKMDKSDGVFVELREKSNGDAYDRTGTVFIIPEDKSLSFYDALSKGVKMIPAYQNGNGKLYYGATITNDYLPAIELMRFFTPFGVNKFNTIQLKGKTWTTETPYRQDISDLKASINDKEVWVGVFIGNYDKGGHMVDLEITVHQDGLNGFSGDFQLPIFNTLNIMEMAGQDYATMFNSKEGLKVEFELKSPVKNAMLRFITSGHGGWEKGDEFVPKKNTIILDGKEAYSFFPWRTDCGSYRLHNPASGNFGNGLSSSDLSRSNWCPGTITNPNYISLGDLSAGKHTISVLIPQGENEGNSFSSWNVSGIIIGEK